MREEDFLLGMLEMPDDNAFRMMFADWLEERVDPRGEWLRLTHRLTQNGDVADRAAGERRLRALAGAGVQPVGPRWTNSCGMQFTWVPPGTFMRGSPAGEPDRHDDEA